MTQHNVLLQNKQSSYFDVGLFLFEDSDAALHVTLGT